MKKVIIILMSLFIVISPLITINNNSFAESQPSWVYVTQQDDKLERSVVIAIIKGYLGARGYNNSFTYNVEKTIVQWSYNNWDNFAKSKGYNGLSDLNNHIAYRYNNSGKLQFFLDGSSLEMLNQIYTAILEYYNITENTNKQIYDGEYFEDDNNNGCYVFYVSTRSLSREPESMFNTYCQKVGTPYTLANGYPYTGTFLYHNLNTGNNNLSLTVNNTIYNYSILNTNNTDTDNFSYLNISDSLQNTYFTYANGSNYYYYDGYLGVFKYQNYYYFGRYCHYRNTRNGVTKSYYDFNALMYLANSQGINASISAAQAGMNAGIVAAGKAAAITTGKEGANAIKDYLEDNDSTDDDDVIPVDGPDEPDTPTNPSLPTGTTLTPDGNNGFNFNFQMPDFSGFNWNLGFDINNMPFPFSIPFDIIKFLQVLDSTPQAPKYEIHTTIYNTPVNLDIDLSVFNDGMVIIRNIILAGYCIFLIIATRSLFHIY